LLKLGICDILIWRLKRHVGPLFRIKPFSFSEVHQQIGYVSPQTAALWRRNNYIYLKHVAQLRHFEEFKALWLCRAYLKPNAVSEKLHLKKHRPERGWLFASIPFTTTMPTFYKEWRIDNKISFAVNGLYSKLNKRTKTTYFLNRWKC
jgi:hypothetical protein